MTRTVYITDADEETWDAAKREADRRGLSLSKVVLLALRKEMGLDTPASKLDALIREVGPEFVLQALEQTTGGKA